MLSAAALSLMLFSTPAVKAQTITTDTQGTHDGFFYSFWNQNGAGQVSMTLGPKGNYSTKWCCGMLNFTAGKGWKPGSADKVINFSGQYDGGSNGFLAVYGWTRDPLIEYYIVETHGQWTPPGQGVNAKGTYQSDGGTYKVFETTRTQQPSIDGTQTFQQFWAVRESKRTNGTVTFANHVEGWKRAGMNLGSSYDYMIIESEGYRSEGNSNITLLDGGTVTNVLENNNYLADKGLSAYPNPTIDKIAVHVPVTGSEAEVSILGMDGSQLMVTKTYSSKVDVDMTQFDAGVYMLKVVTDVETLTQKIVKQ